VRTGLLSTAGDVLFAGGPSNDIVALDARDGRALWHAGLNGTISNGPITYELDGRQYVVAAAGDTLWAFVLNGPSTLLPPVVPVVPGTTVPAPPS
jgi:alcohol dehydrogenase (cytochrome c)